MGTLLCFNVYLPPKISNFQDKGKLWDQLHIILENLTSQYLNSEIISCGDFNRRTGLGNTGPQINTSILVASLLDHNSVDPTIKKSGPTVPKAALFIHPI